jgi:hypothetical protein
MENGSSAHRMFRLARIFFSNVVPGVLRPLRILWNEVLGAVFLIFAVMLGRPTWRAWQTLDTDPANLIRALLSTFFMAMMAGFGIHAFWRARRIGQTRPYSGG